MADALKYAAVAVLAGLIALLCIGVFKPAGRPYVLLVGDSISECYASGVAEKLGDRYRVGIIQENGRSTRILLEHLDEWVISEKPDIVVLNAGLHDIAFRSDGPVPLDEYEKNLTEIVRRIKAGTGARVIWATTTPVIDEVHFFVHGFVRREKDVVRYNEASLRVMKALRVQVVDLHAVVIAADPAKLYEDGLHPDPRGSALLADAVAKAVTGSTARWDR